MIVAGLNPFKHNFLGIIFFATTLVVHITAMIIYLFAVSSAVQMYEISYTVIDFHRIQDPVA